jgi:MFS family permease
MPDLVAGISQGSNRLKRRLLAGISTNVLVLGIVSLLTDMSSEMIYPIMPLFLSIIGASGLVIGLIEGASETTASLLKVVSGWYSDKFDRRKPFITSGYGLSSLIKPVLIWATSPFQVLGIKIAERVGKGIRSAPRDALIADSTPPGIRGMAFGFHKAMDSLGAVIGPIITLAIILSVAIGTLAEEEAAYRLVFTVAVIPALVAVVVIVFFVREKEAVGKRLARTFKRGMSELSRPFWMLMAVVLVFYIGEISYVFFILKAQVVDEDLVMIIGLYVLYNVMFVLVSIPAGNLSDRIGRKPIILVAFGLFALTCLIMATASSLIFLSFGFAVFGVQGRLGGGLEGIRDGHRAVGPQGNSARNVPYGRRTRHVAWRHHRGTSLRPVGSECHVRLRSGDGTLGLGPPHLREKRRRSLGHAVGLTEDASLFSTEIVKSL